VEEAANFRESSVGMLFGMFNEYLQGAEAGFDDSFDAESDIGEAE
jgi:hypothetical protein